MARLIGMYSRPARRMMEQIASFNLAEERNLVELAAYPMVLLDLQKELVGLC